MKIYIAHFFTEYESNDDEKYSYAKAFKTRAEAEKAIRDEMISHLFANGIEDDEETTAEQEIEYAFENSCEGHDAILHYKDCICYLDITEQDF